MRRVSKALAERLVNLPAVTNMVLGYYGRFTLQSRVCLYAKRFACGAADCPYFADEIAACSPASTGRNADLSFPSS